MRLRIELVPQKLHGHNLRSDAVGIGKNHWSKLRKALFAEQGVNCAICGSPEKPHAHEIWKYEEKSKQGVARLIGIEVVCARCHYVHHWGSTKSLVSEGKMDSASADALIQHFMNVNACSKKDFERYESRSMAEWRRRNKLKWRIDWGEYRKLINAEKSGRRALAESVQLPFKCFNSKCKNRITLSFPAQHRKTKKRQGIRYFCEKCKSVDQIELGPGTLGTSIIKGALVLFSADADSLEWKKEIAG